MRLAGFFTVMSAGTGSPKAGEGWHGKNSTNTQLSQLPFIKKEAFN